MLFRQKWTVLNLLSGCILSFNIWWHGTLSELYKLAQQRTQQDRKWLLALGALSWACAPSPPRFLWERKAPVSLQMTCSRGEPEGIIYIWKWKCTHKLTRSFMFGALLYTKGLLTGHLYTPNSTLDGLDRRKAVLARDKTPSSDSDNPQRPRSSGGSPWSSSNQNESLCTSGSAFVL